MIHQPQHSPSPAHPLSSNFQPSLCYSRSFRLVVVYRIPVRQQSNLLPQYDVSPIRFDWGRLHGLVNGKTRVDPTLLIGVLIGLSCSHPATKRIIETCEGWRREERIDEQGVSVCQCLFVFYMRDTSGQMGQCRIEEGRQR